MIDESDTDYVSIDLDEAAAVEAISRTTGVNKARVLGMLVRKGMGKPPKGPWEKRVYQLIDDTARQFDDEDMVEEPPSAALDGVAGHPIPAQRDEG